MIRKLLIIILIAVIPMISTAQKSRKWKKLRYEVIGGIGATCFLGELGGADKVGTHFLNDFEISSTRPLFFVGGRYKLAERVAYKTGFFWGWLNGDDKKTKEPARANRNLSFRSQIIEFNNQIEYSIIKEPKSHKYSIQKVPGSGSWFNFKTNTYIFTGINIFYFNPKTLYDGKWVALQPLGTEGQGLIPTRSKYSRISVSVPLGLGFKWSIDRLWCIGLEYGYRITFTDYMDDVSKSYVSSNLFQDEQVKKLADRSDGTNPSWTQAGEQRGDPRYKDAYMFMSVSLVYKLRTGKSGRPMF